MAHGFMQSFDSRLQVFSAGTEASGKLNSTAVKVMREIDLDISANTSNSVNKYLNEKWDYVITVCGGANESCPSFLGDVKHRLHIGFDDPSHAQGREEFIMSEFYRVRDDIKEAFYKLYNDDIKANL
jgi:arsenate reductase